ncbi:MULTISPECIES: SulP family inorganic anion transporter [Pseudovibrio]|uniref:SulP family inorganic anion transporter n=1 Tax=Stappiaceae TaxID=2821832 RepID=UPI0023669DEC|nr:MULTISPECIES: SulP family inorganic anion transporter [Pseudovibrio]MDD7909205.1 SulP family inorganic anion transporter [Pseudovibrio exalbescens]MDX5595248.1 SulP family inorganic anion transporter [Pseudovibrio sp. SPO723]
MSVNLIKTEVLAGLTVALALVPEAVAFAFVAQVHPLVGLYAAFIVGIITAVFGGRPGMISGATGALAVVMVSLVSQHGVEYLFAAVVLMGILQIIFGIMRWGKFIRMVPHPVMLGFVNGLAIVIFIAQFSQFKVEAPTGGDPVWMEGLQLYMMLGLIGLTMFVIWVTPKITSAVPAPLAGILVVSAIVIGAGLDVRTVGDMSSIAGGLPQFHIPMVPLTLETLEIIFPYALILAAIGLIESLLTLNLVSEMTNTKGGASKECLAQGAANVVTGFFGGMGGCAMIGQSMINVKSGARTRIAGIMAALFLLAFILFASPLIEQIPLAALVGVMFMVVVGTFAWNTFKILNKIPRTDAVVIAIVTGVTVAEDLAVAVVVGVIISALAYAWNASKRINARVSMNEKGQKEYVLEGPLFFGSAAGFQEIFTPEQDPDDVIVDFINSRVVDHSGLQAIDSMAARYIQLGKTLHLRHLSPDCKRLLSKAGDMVELSVMEDPRYGVAVDYDHKFDEEPTPQKA